MTMKEFFELLPKDRWFVCGDGVLRRLTGKDTCQCPVTAAAGEPNLKAFSAGRKIGLRMHQINMIMKAADNKKMTPLRTKFMRHMGLML